MAGLLADNGLFDRTIEADMDIIVPDTRYRACASAKLCPFESEPMFRFEGAGCRLEFYRIINMRGFP